MRGSETSISRDNPPHKPLFASVPSRLTPSLPPIKGFLESTFIDWPGRHTAILFLGGCNFRCPFCHNHPLVLAPQGIDTIDYQTILASLRRNQKWLEGVCISGGEPTLSPGLPELIRLLKAEGWDVKLDTNGSQPETLKALLDENLLDMVAMDVKTVLEQKKYERCAGTEVDLAAIKASISLLQQSNVSHEFRMTALPRFHSAEDIKNWVTLLQGKALLKLQNFNPKTTLLAEMEKEKGFPLAEFEHLKTLLH